jgi:hypothetical protein
MRPQRLFLCSSPGIPVTLSGKSFALALQLHQTSADIGIIVSNANPHRFFPRPMQLS